MTQKKTFKRLLSLGSACLLAACASAIEGDFQHVKFETPGALGSKCNVMVDGSKFVTYPPGTVSIPKTSGDMEIECLAPGNRRKSVVVPSRVSSAYAMNVGNPVGAVYDVASGAMSEFPDIIQISFLDVPVRDDELPLHDDPTLKPPSDHFLEEFKPDAPRLNEDRFRTSTPIKRRERSVPSSQDAFFGVEESAVSTYGPQINSGVPANVDPAEFAPVSSSLFNDDFSRFNDPSDVETFPVQ